MEINVSLFQFDVGDQTFVAPQKLRGYLGCTFAEHDIVHNHLQNGLRYEYPTVQYKIIEALPTIVCFNEGSEVLQQLFFQLDSLDIDGREIDVYERTYRQETFIYGDAEDPVEYEFITPWLPLNQNNYRSYQQLSTDAEKKAELERILIGNILSQAKGLDYWVENQLEVNLAFETIENCVRYKGNQFQGFKGSFTVNFHLPHYLGIGKGVSRGYGTLQAVRHNGMTA